MQLQDLGLNRYMYKDIQGGGLDYSFLGQGQNPYDVGEIDFSLMLSQNNTSNYGADSGSGAYGGGAGPSAPDPSAAKNVQTATVITSSIVQSSPSPNRVELAPYITSQTGLTGIFLSDSLVAYNNNLAAVLINKDGIDANFIEVRNLTVEGYFNYGPTGGPTIRQPVLFSGSVKYDGTIHFIQPGWSVTKTGIGTYKVTHNLNSSIYAVNLTDFSEIGGPASIITWTVDNYGLNDFTAKSFDNTSTPTDSSFFFSVFLNLP